ncbi:MAG: endopeptidase La [Oscillospiraceae bacterium]|jgi:ATP-dependent Lon protease|nr:endopeptidase La [Oscillospiraceae bacterium]
MDDNLCDPEQTETVPMLALRGLCVFPGLLLNFDVERSKSTASLDASSEFSRKIFLLAQKDIMKETPREDDLYRVGTICYVKQMLKLPGGGMKALVEGICRARLVNIVSDRKYFVAEAKPIPEPEPARRSVRGEALARKSVNLFDTYAALSQMVSRETVLSLYAMSDPGKIADHIAQHVFVKHDSRQRVLEAIQPVRRLELVCEILAHEIEVLTIERQIDDSLRARLEGQHREHVLREQMRAIQNELGETNELGSETGDYREKILKLKLSEEAEAKLIKETDKLEKQQYGSAESSVIRNYLDLCLELPWNKVTAERVDVAAARKILDDDHFGLDKVKERIIEFLAVKQLKPDLKGTILCFVGPPGVGKTSVAISIARSLNRKLARLSLGGIHDEAEIRGHRKTYVGAMPGRIIAAVNQSGSRNPLMLLDEIDKLGSDYRGDPAAALLEALDPEQNATFRDHYLEVPFDLSDVMFITTANTVSTIPRPLLDRMEVIELSSYTDMEKLEIAKRHLIPKQRKKHGMTARQLKFSDEAVLEMVASYTRESGVRVLEREIAAACRKTAVKIARGEIKAASVGTGVLEEYLGVRKYKPETLAKGDEVGLVKGLAWTSVGGTTLDVEVNVLPGTGKLNLTGNLGDVMKESAQAALSYIRSRAAVLKIDPEFYKKYDIHIHFPEGAVPKDGPSAGIAIAVAIISALTGAPVRRVLAMTGEITLRGRVLPIGGLKEKTMAALRVGVKTVIIPADNEPNLEEIDKTVRRALNFITAEHIDGVLAVALDFEHVREDLKPSLPPSAAPAVPETLPPPHGAAIRQ